MLWQRSLGAAAARQRAALRQGELRRPCLLSAGAPLHQVWHPRRHLRPQRRPHALGGDRERQHRQR
jgi:hypothetical protein